MERVFRSLKTEWILTTGCPTTQEAQRDISHFFDASVQHSKWIAKLGGLGYDYLILINRFVNWCLLRMGKEPYSFSKKIKASVKKAVKFIIEVAALTNHQIIQISVLIKNTIIANFKEDNFAHIFVKSSTGFYKSENNLPNGATIPTIILMLENSNPLPVKAAGGVRTLEEALVMIRLGVKRIGTSAAKSIADGNVSTGNY